MTFDNVARSCIFEEYNWRSASDMAVTSIASCHSCSPRCLPANIAPNASLLKHVTHIINIVANILQNTSSLILTNIPLAVLILPLICITSVDLS